MQLLKMSVVSGSISSLLSSVRFTLALIFLLIALAVAGACIPQVSQVENALEAHRSFNQSFPFLAWLGLDDVFNSWPFLSCVSGLFVNLIACTILKMPEKIRSRLKKDDFLDVRQVAGLKEAVSFHMPCQEKGAREYLHGYMEALGYRVSTRGNSLLFQKGTAGWLAAPITHLGLLLLLTGVLLSSLFSYSGMLYLKEGDVKDIPGALTQKGPLAKVPFFSVKLLSSKNEVYPAGEPKQWFSTVSVSGGQKQALTGVLSVNCPLEIEGVDFYQSDWKIAAVAIGINGREATVPLMEMLHGRMGILKLADDLSLICFLDAESRLKVYLKQGGLSQWRFLAALSPGQCLANFPVRLCYVRALPQSGIKFKSDPGLWLTYTSFLLFFAGSIFVAIPNLKVCAAVESVQGAGARCWLGFNGVKSAYLMRAHIRKVERGARRQFNADNLGKGVVAAIER